jgi:hypothetical protein
MSAMTVRDPGGYFAGLPRLKSVGAAPLVS